MGREDAWWHHDSGQAGVAMRLFLGVVRLPIGALARRDERGASLVEAAIAGPVFLFFLFAVISGALYAQSANSAEYAALNGARAAAVAGDRSDADFKVLKAIDEATTAFSNRDSMRVVVYRATGPEMAVPDQCRTTGVPDLCNVYTGLDFAKAQSDFTAGSAWTAPFDWAARHREVSRSAGVDYVGVYVEADCGCMADSFGFPVKVDKATVVQLEARAG
jgi:Flp pilus assembly protein TadG